MKSAKKEGSAEAGRLRGNLLSPKRVAEMLDVALPTVYKWVKQRRIPHIVLSVGKRKETVRYQHLSPERLRSAVEAMDEAVESPASEEGAHP